MITHTCFGFFSGQVIPTPVRCAASKAQSAARCGALDPWISGSPVILNTFAPGTSPRNRSKPLRPQSAVHVLSGPEEVPKRMHEVFGTQCAIQTGSKYQERFFTARPEKAHPYQRLQGLKGVLVQVSQPLLLPIRICFGMLGIRNSDGVKLHEPVFSAQDFKHARPCWSNSFPSWGLDLDLYILYPSCMFLFDSTCRNRHVACWV